ncbi:MAG: hypothetical protein ACLFSJ_02420 [Halorhodospira sp.]
MFLGERHVAIAAIHPDGEQLLACDYREATGEAQQGALRELVQAYGLRRCPATLVLRAAEYRLQQVDIPGIPDEELNDALRFRLKDLLSMPLSEAAVAGHRQRSDRRRSEQGLTMAVIARRSRIETLAQTVAAAELRPSAIISQETAMHELAAQTPGADSGVALVLLSDNAGGITVSRGGELFLARSHGVSLNALRNETGAIDRLGAEIQRTVDYYDSQLSNQPASRALLLPTTLDREVLLETLGETARVPIGALDLTQVLAPPEEAAPPDPITQARCILAVAGAMPIASGATVSLYQPPDRSLRYDAPAAIMGYVAAGALGLAVLSLVQGQLLDSAEEQRDEVQARQDRLLEEVTALRERLEEREPPEALEAEHDRLEERLAQTRELGEQLERIEARSLAGLTEALRALARQELQPVWLTRFRLGLDGGGFEGYALEPAQVMRFIDHLAGAEIFQGVVFQDLAIERAELAASTAAAEGQQAYQFRLVAPDLPGLKGEGTERAWAQPDTAAGAAEGEEAAEEEE